MKNPDITLRDGVCADCKKRRVVGSNGRCIPCAFKLIVKEIDDRKYNKSVEVDRANGRRISPDGICLECGAWTGVCMC